MVGVAPAGVLDVLGAQASQMGEIDGWDVAVRVACAASSWAGEVAVGKCRSPLGAACQTAKRDGKTVQCSSWAGTQMRWFQERRPAAPCSQQLQGRQRMVVVGLPFSRMQARSK